MEELFSKERCLLTRVPIEAGDDVVRVLLWRRDIQPWNEGDYFLDVSNFRDVVQIEQGTYDGATGLLEVNEPKDSDRCWFLFFHQAAWYLAQTFNRSITPAYYDPASMQRDEVLRLYELAKKKTKRKVKIDPLLRPIKFPGRILEFARVVMYAYQIGAQLVPPICGPTDEGITGSMNKFLACSNLASMIWHRKLQTELCYDDIDMEEIVVENPITNPQEAPADAMELTPEVSDDPSDAEVVVS
jgi:hypothetical protein